MSEQVLDYIFSTGDFTENAQAFCGESAIVIVDEFYGRARCFLYTNTDDESGGYLTPSMMSEVGGLFEDEIYDLLGRAVAAFGADAWVTVEVNHAPWFITVLCDAQAQPTSKTDLLSLARNMR